MMRLDSTAARLRQPVCEPVAQNAEPDVARLLGMKLHAGDVVALDRSAEGHAVVADRSRGVDHRARRRNA